MKQRLNFERYIEKYLEGKMSREESIWFEKEMENDQELKEEVLLEKSINETLKEKEIMDLYGQLNDIHAAAQKKNTRIIPIHKRKKKYIYSMSGIAACLAVVIMLTTGNKKLSNSEAFNEYFNPAEINMSFRSAGDDINMELRKAMEFYEDKKYEEAINIFEKVLDKDSSRIGLNLYSGISHMEIEMYDEANMRFRRIINDNKNAFVESAKWYLGLCYLRTNDKDKAVGVFKDISENNGYYKEDAEELLNRLN